MKKNLLFVITFLAVVFVLSSVSNVQAATMPTNTELMDQIQELREMVMSQNARIAELEKQIISHSSKVASYCGKVDEHAQLIDKEGLRDISADMRRRLEGLEEMGPIEIGASATFVVQGTPNANGASGDKEDDRTDASWTSEIELAKAFGDRGFAYILMEPGQGAGLDEDLSLFSPVNFDASDTGASPDITEVWYEHYLFDGQLAVTFGKLYFPNYLDTNEYANDENTQFLSQIFRNAPTIDYPSSDWCIGVRGSYSPAFADFVSFEGMVGEADGDYEQIFDRPFVAAQVNLRPDKLFNYDGEKWGGNYRVYFAYNGDDHTEFDDPEMTKEPNYSMGVSCDQKLTEIFGVFGRFGWQYPAVSDIEFSWSMGGQMTGEYWKRENDVFGIAIGQLLPGKPYGDNGNPNNTETHLEAYYSIQVNDHIAISPDMQFIWGPNGVANEEQGKEGPIFVYGLRTFIDF